MSSSGSGENLFLRDDTFFGVCEALGQDFHIPANLLRLGLAPLLIWNPLATVVGYLSVGIVIAAIRFLFPNRRRGRGSKGTAEMTATAETVAAPAKSAGEAPLAQAA